MGARILVADDEPEVAQFLVDFLTMQGHRVEKVGDGSALVRRGVESVPDLIITDVQMPGKYGSTAYQSLRGDERTKGIPIIFISALPLDAVMPYDANTRFLPKPVDTKALDDAVRELLAGK
jgi:DNA-binding response OmpR family regulator